MEKLFCNNLEGELEREIWVVVGIFVRKLVIRCNEKVVY